ncbi:hypothetical protein [Actinomadura madurae]|nr:hypothetical protein [Actinomadura madurae]
MTSLSNHHPNDHALHTGDAQAPHRGPAHDSADRVICLDPAKVTT